MATRTKLNDAQVLFKYPCLEIYFTWVNCENFIDTLESNRDNREWQDNKSQNFNLESLGFDKNQFLSLFTNKKIKLKTHSNYNELLKSRQNIDAINEHFNINLFKMSYLEFYNFLKNVYFKKYPNVYNFSHLNLLDLNERGFGERISSFKSIKEKYLEI